MRELTAEHQKQKHRRIWLVPLGFLVILFLWVSVNRRSFTAEDLAMGYSYILYQLPLLNVVLLPVMTAVIASRLCDMEIKGNTLKQLYTLQKRSSFYDWKFIHELKYLLAFTIGEGIMIPLMGAFCHFTQKLPLILSCSIGTSTLVGLVLLTLQHFLSLMSNNQIIPLLAGLIGSFLGLFSMFFPPAAARFVLWGYFSAFTPTACITTTGHVSCPFT
ncbi:MAG: ABC transporter permease [Blautia marasmi]